MAKRSKSLRKSSKKKRSNPGKCKRYLKKKISINIEEYKSGMFVSIPQAIAVAYSQTIKKFPHCKRYLSRKPKKSRSRSRK